MFSHAQQSMNTTSQPVSNPPILSLSATSLSSLISCLSMLDARAGSNKANNGLVIITAKPSGLKFSVFPSKLFSVTATICSESFTSYQYHHPQQNVQLPITTTPNGTSATTIGMNERTDSTRVSDGGIGGGPTATTMPEFSYDPIALHELSQETDIVTSLPNLLTTLQLFMDTGNSSSDWHNGGASGANATFDFDNINMNYHGHHSGWNNASMNNNNNSNNQSLFLTFRSIGSPIELVLRKMYAPNSTHGIPTAISEYNPSEGAPSASSLLAIPGEIVIQATLKTINESQLNDAHSVMEGLHDTVDSIPTEAVTTTKKSRKNGKQQTTAQTSTPNPEQSTTSPADSLAMNVRALRLNQFQNLQAQTASAAHGRHQDNDDNTDQVLDLAAQTQHKLVMHCRSLMFRDLLRNIISQSRSGHIFLNCSQWSFRNIKTMQPPIPPCQLEPFAYGSSYHNDRFSHNNNGNDYDKNNDNSTTPNNNSHDSIHLLPHPLHQHVDSLLFCSTTPPSHVSLATPITVQRRVAGLPSAASIYRMLLAMNNTHQPQQTSVDLAKICTSREQLEYIKGAVPVPPCHYLSSYYLSSYVAPRSFCACYLLEDLNRLLKRGLAFNTSRECVVVITHNDVMHVKIVVPVSTDGLPPASRQSCNVVEFCLAAQYLPTTADVQHENGFEVTEQLFSPEYSSGTALRIDQEQLNREALKSRIRNFQNSHQFINAHQSVSSSSKHRTPMSTIQTPSTLSKLQFHQQDLAENQNYHEDFENKKPGQRKIKTEHPSASNQYSDFTKKDESRQSDDEQEDDQESRSSTGGSSSSGVTPSHFVARVRSRIHSQHPSTHTDEHDLLTDDNHRSSTRVPTTHTTPGLPGNSSLAQKIQFHQRQSASNKRQTPLAHVYDEEDDE